MCIANKIWVDKSREFYNISLKSCLERNDIDIYWTRNERKSVVKERFMRTLKNKIYKYLLLYLKMSIMINFQK